MASFRENNFDLIRLFAALQVAILHISEFMKVDLGESVFVEVLKSLPGVPVFFFVSGFLISRSYESNPNLWQYGRNRVLRIYPALVVCTIVSILSVWASGYFRTIDVGIGRLLLFVLGQLTIFQVYHPVFMRGYGNGVMNGSLWTIVVELQFYIVVPFVYWVLRLVKTTSGSIVISILIILFGVVGAGYCSMWQECRDNIIFKLWGVTFAPWIYMFFVGVLFQKNFIRLHTLLANKFLYIFPIYLLVAFLTSKYMGFKTGNFINPILFLLLSASLFSFAYSYTKLSRKLLRGTDLSYGIYIYHIPVTNLLIYHGYHSSTILVYLTLAVSLLLAALSWYLVERPCIRLKRHPLNPV